MSFSGKVKDELLKHISSAKHCRVAEITAIKMFFGHEFVESTEQGSGAFIAEHDAIIRKFFTLQKKTDNIGNDLKLNEILKSACCKRAFLRGAFLCIGSVSDPEKSNHLEFVCNDEKQAQLLQGIMQEFDIVAKMVLRKKYFVVYLKDGTEIVDLLNVMEAHVSLMEFENQRILKEISNTVNRRVNCETANIAKTVNASTKQLEDILLIRDKYGLRRLPDNLREMAEVRIENPDATLKELGEYLNPPVGKSGVNHRLRRLGEIADKLR